MFPHLTRLNYLIAQEIRFGEYLCDDLCYIKYLGLLFGDIVLWKLSYHHSCENCLIPVKAVMYNIDELKDVIGDVICDKKYQQYISNTIKTVEKGTTNKMLTTFHEAVHL